VDARDKRGHDGEAYDLLDRMTLRAPALSLQA
jgi:hypothetical protein